MLEIARLFRSALDGDTHQCLRNIFRVNKRYRVSREMASSESNASKLRSSPMRELTSEEISAVVGGNKYISHLKKNDDHARNLHGRNLKQNQDHNHDIHDIWDAIAAADERRRAADAAKKRAGGRR